MERNWLKTTWSNTYSLLSWIASQIQWLHTPLLKSEPDSSHLIQLVVLCHPMSHIKSCFYWLNRTAKFIFLTDELCEMDPGHGALIFVAWKSDILSRIYIDLNRVAWTWQSSEEKLSTLSNRYSRRNFTCWSYNQTINKYHDHYYWHLNRRR